jgi:predicted nucleic acid-binding protein
LDLGEAQAIALAEELGADLLVIDEWAARRAANDLGFQVVGTLGILLESKRQGWCDQIRPSVDKRQRELGFFLSPIVRRKILALAGEAEPADAGP